MSLAVTNSVVMDRWINEPLSNFSVSKNLNNVHFYLDLVLLASESLIPITTDMIFQSSLDLGINTYLTKEIKLWSGQDVKKSRDFLEGCSVKQTKLSTILICCVIEQHEELIRRAITLLEQMTQQNKDPKQSTLLGKYFSNFSYYYKYKVKENKKLSIDEEFQLASKLLLDLLFYSSDSGYIRLWSTSLNYSLLNFHDITE